MTSDEINRIADAVADRLAPLFGNIPGNNSDELIDASEVARRFNVDRSWVYSNANKLDAVRLGSGDRPRLRFDPETVAAAIGRPRRVERSAPGPARRSPKLSKSELLPVRGEA